MAELTVTEPEPTAVSLPVAPVENVDPTRPCRAGNAEDLDTRVFERLAGAGYQLTRGTQTDGISIRLRPRIIMGLCAAMSGTDNRGCPAIDQVIVEFIGSSPGVETPVGFTLRNRCGGEGLLDVNGLGYLLAARLDYALSTFPGDRGRCLVASGLIGPNAVACSCRPPGDSRGRPRK